MYSDSNFFIFILTIIAIIFLSQSTTKCFSFGSYYKYCCLFVIVVYPLLGYLIMKSIKYTSENKNENKHIRYIVNGILLASLILLWITSVIEFVVNIDKTPINKSINVNNKNNINNRK